MSKPRGRSMRMERVTGAEVLRPYEQALVAQRIHLVQITGVGDHLYGLDTSGDVWEYQTQGNRLKPGWRRLTMERS